MKRFTHFRHMYKCHRFWQYACVCCGCQIGAGLRCVSVTSLISLIKKHDICAIVNALNNSYNCEKHLKSFLLDLFFYIKWNRKAAWNYFEVLKHVFFFSVRSPFTVWRCFLAWIKPLSLLHKGIDFSLFFAEFYDD